MEQMLGYITVLIHSSRLQDQRQQRKLKELLSSLGCIPNDSKMRIIYINVYQKGVLNTALQSSAILLKVSKSMELILLFAARVMYGNII